MDYNSQENNSNTDCEYLAFVDASGDDGYKFQSTSGNGSSYCFTVAVFISHIDDFDYNKGVLDSCKSLYGLQNLNDELKYSKIRRHRNTDMIHAEMLKVKGQLLIWTAFKRKLMVDNEMVQNDQKQLSSYCHLFPILQLREIIPNKGNPVLIFIDRMKKIEELNVKVLANAKENNLIIQFKDSKEMAFIQIADFFAGMFRGFMEQVCETSRLNDICPPCIRLRINVRSMKNARLCSYKKRKRPLENSRYIRESMRLLPKHVDSNGVLSWSVSVFPIEFCHRLQYIDCLLNPEYKIK